VLWQKRTGTTPGHPETALDLRSISGLPGRLSFTEGVAGRRLSQVACTVRRVDSADIVVEIPEGLVAPGPENAVILEVVDKNALVQCFTTVRMAPRQTELMLRTPARPHVVQRRRFPRIDLFVAVTLATPDRSIEPMAAQMINMSPDGAACVVAEPMSPGTPITVNMMGLGLFPAEAHAVVRRCTPSPSRLWVVGLQFQNLDRGQELYLEKYVTDYIEQQSE